MFRTRFQDIGSDPFGLALPKRKMIEELAPALTVEALAHDPAVDREWLAESLSLSSAKAWLAEDVLALCPECKGGWTQSYTSDVHIVNGRWEQSSHTHAIWGRQ